MENFNKRLVLQSCTKREDVNNINELIETILFNFPKDYINFVQNYESARFVIKDQDVIIWLQSLEFSIENTIRNKEIIKKNMPKTFIIGNNFKNLLFILGEGHEGFGFYIASKEVLNRDNMIKLSDSLSDFFIDGVGINILLDY